MTNHIKLALIYTIGIVIAALSALLFLQLWGLELASILISSDKHFWYLSRASGVMAYELAWLSVMFGLLLSTRLANTFDVTSVVVLHRYLSIGTLIMVLFHALILLGDDYLSTTVGQLALPFGMPNQMVAVGLGQMAFYGLLICVASYYLKNKLGYRLWRGIHFLAFLAFMSLCCHAILAGSDTRSGMMLLFYAATQASVFVLVFYRISSR